MSTKGRGAVTPVSDAGNLIMRTMVRNALFGLLAASLAVPAADLKEELQTNFDQACQSQKFMGVISLTVNDRIVFSAACGLADAEWSVKNTGLTLASQLLR